MANEEAKKGGDLKVENLKKIFLASTRQVEIQAHFSVQAHERIAIQSPSGTGKTTLLRMIAGLEQSDQGRVTLFGKDLALTPIEKRRIGFVFQESALFQGSTALENIAFPLKVRGVPHQKRTLQAKELLLELGFSENQMEQKVDLFSGGEKQRVALARALVFQPDLILLDEPFSALDVRSKHHSIELLLAMHSKHPVPLLMVTHNDEDVSQVATQVLKYQFSKNIDDKTSQTREIHQFFR